MASYPPPRAHDLLTAAYNGLPNADPNISMTEAVRLVPAAIHDLRHSSDPKFRLGATYLDIAEALAAKGKPWLVQSDFQAAIDYLEAKGEVSAVETSRGTCYSLTASGRLDEEARRVPPWRKELRAWQESVLAALRGRLANIVIGFILGLIASQAHGFIKALRFVK